MQLLFTRARDARGAGADDNLGRGMEAALLIAVFLGLGWLIDSATGTRPLFMIVLTLFAAIGVFVRMKYAYDAAMEALEAERRDNATSRHGMTPRRDGQEAAA